MANTPHREPAAFAPPVSARSRARRGFLPVFAAPLVLLAGCSVGPDFARPEAPKSAGYRSEALPDATAAADVAGGESQRLSKTGDIPARWWTRFGSPALDSLVDEALRANPDLQSARAALHVAMENAKAQEGSYYPQLAANFGGGRSGNSTVLSPTLNTGPLLFNLYQAQLSANWTIDVWGGNRRTVEALRAQADGQRFQLESVCLALSANVVAAAVQEASLRAQIAAVRDIVATESDSLAILRRQNGLGQIAGADVAAQEAALAQAEQVLPPLEKQLAQQRDLLSALTGGLPDRQVAQTFDLASLQLPRDIPVGVPSRLVAQRPDIRIAQENLHAASAQIGVAIADMLPNIALTAGMGSAATAVGRMFTPGSGFWSVAGGLTQPIFEGGTLLHKTRAARAAYDQAAAQYRSTVDTAFQNVADTLYALQYDAETLKAAAAAQHAAADSLSIARRQLALGAVSYVALLSAQQTYQQAVIVRIQAQAGRLADTAALFQALGGGWWNRADAAETRTADIEIPGR